MLAARPHTNVSSCDSLRRAVSLNLLMVALITQRVHCKLPIAHKDLTVI
jgi:hypothetical protein